MSYHLLELKSQMGTMPLNIRIFRQGLIRRLLTMASTSTTIVNNSSYVSLHPTTKCLKLLLALITKASHNLSVEQNQNTEITIIKFLQ